jgi:hypothetical protein
MLIQTQGWLVVPSVLVIVNERCLPSLFVGVLLLVFAVAGGLAAIVFLRSIHAAMAEQEKILFDNGSAIGLSFPFRGSSADKLVKALQAEGVHKTLGRGINSWIPGVIIVLWVILLLSQVARHIYAAPLC